MEYVLNKDEHGVAEKLAMHIADVAERFDFVENHDDVSCKISFIVSLLDNMIPDGHNVLIFSQTRKMLNLIQKRKSSDKEPTLFDLHKEIHMRKNGTFVDDRAKRICDDYDNKLIEESTTRTFTTTEQNEIYKEIVGVKKQRVYGIDSMSESYGSDGRTSASCLLENGPKEAELNQLKNELADEKAKVAKLEETVDCEKKNREKIEEKLERLIERVNDSLGEPSN